MKKHLKVLSVFLSLLAVFSLFPTRDVMAAGKIGFYLTPASQTLVIGSSFSVRFMVDITNRTSNWVTLKGKISYPKDRLQITTLDTSGSNYTSFVSTTFDNATGVVNFNRTNTSVKADSTYVFTINFKTVSTGTAPVTFTDVTGQSSEPTYANGGTYSIVPPTCPAGQVGTPPNCSTPPPKPTPTPTPTPKPTPTPTPATESPTPTPQTETSPEVAPVQTPAGELTIHDVSAKTSWEHSTLTWSSSLSEITSSLKLGTSKDALKDGPEVIIKEDGSYQTTMSDLQPGTRYYYLITSTLNSDSTKQATYSGAFTTKGYPVSLTFTNNNEPTIGIKVSIDSGTYTTDKNGTIQLELANKKYDAIITTNDNATQKVSFTVAKKTISNDTTPEVQKFTFALTATATQNTPTANLPLGMIIATAVGGVALLGGIGGFLFYRRRKIEQLALPNTSVEDYSWSGPISTLSPPQIEPDTPLVNPLAPDTEYEQPIYTDPIPHPSTDSVENIGYLAEAPESPVTPLSEPSPPTPPLSPEPQAHLSELSASPPAAPIELAEDNSRLVSANPAPPQDPSAIFDPDTGELSIIHHPSSSRPTGGVT